MNNLTEIEKLKIENKNLRQALDTALCFMAKGIEKGAYRHIAGNAELIYQRLLGALNYHE